MAEVSASSDAEGKRWLPAWMLKPTTKNEAAKTVCQNKIGSEEEKKPQIVTKDQIKTTKRKSVGRLKIEDTEDNVERGVLKRCQNREKIRRGRTKVVVHDEAEGIDEETDEDGRNVTGRATQKNNSRKRKLENVGTEILSPEATDNEIELTVEDLVSIAEEYVRADKAKQCERQSKEGTHQQGHAPPPPTSTGTVPEGSVRDARAMRGLSQCATARTSCNPSERGGDEKKGPQELRCSGAATTTKTGDAAQDMLDLLLGPLLRKPLDEETEIEAAGATAMDVPGKQEEEEMMHRQVQKQGETATSKKKSSLKDKVALFLG